MSKRWTLKDVERLGLKTDLEEKADGSGNSTRKPKSGADYQQESGGRVKVIVPETLPPAKPSKYRNEKTLVDGITFDSKKEAAYFGILRLMEKQGHIKDLKRQVPFTLSVNGCKVCTYKADFVYEESGQQVVVDVKGVKTKDYKLKERLMLAVHGIIIKVV